MHIAKPTKQQLLWHEMELGVLIHYCLEIYRPELTGDWYKTKAVRTEIPPKDLHPAKLEPEQWIRSYRILVNSTEVYTGRCIGHKRILPLNGLTGDITVEILCAAENWRLRDVTVY